MFFRLPEKEFTLEVEARQPGELVAVALAEREEGLEVGGLPEARHVRLTEADVRAAQDRVDRPPVLQDERRALAFTVAGEPARHSLRRHHGQLPVSCPGQEIKEEIASAHGLAPWR
jgi:hypothetical protein